MIRFLRGFNYWHEVVLAILLLVILFWAGRSEPVFLETDTQVTLAADLWPLALAAIPMTFIILTGGIDLSIGSAIALCAVAWGVTFDAVRGNPADIWIASGVALLVGAAAGALNGLFVTQVRIHPMLVTLATYSAFQGLAEGISKGEPMKDFPRNFAGPGQGMFMGAPVAAWIFLLIFLVASFVLMLLPTGRFIYAIGHNATAARYSGVAVNRIKFLLYTLSGAMAGLVAMIMVSRFSTADATRGRGMELEAVTAVVLGGTNINGGRGTLIGTLLGLLVLHELRHYVSWHWNKDEVNLVVTGGILIASVLMNRIFVRSSKR